jgi:hypothetical protein
MEKLNGLNLVAQVQGKITEVTTHSTRTGRTIYRHILATPAEDEFSHPETVCLLSERRIGDQGALVTASVKIRGRRNKGNNGHTFYNHELWEKV